MSLLTYLLFVYNHNGCTICLVCSLHYPIITCVTDVRDSYTLSTAIAGSDPFYEISITTMEYVKRIHLSVTISLRVRMSSRITPFPWDMFS